MSNQTMVRMGPREQRGFILGLRVPQVLLLLVAATMVVQMLNTPWPAGLLWVVGVAIALLVGFVPWKGRTLDEWIPVFYNYLVQQATGENVYMGGVYRDAEPGTLLLPGNLAHLKPIIYVAGNGEEVLVIKDPLKQRYTAVLVVQGSTFPLLDSARQTSRVVGFEQLLAQLCVPGNLVSRIQILERTVPDSGEAMQRSYARRGIQDGKYADQAYREILRSVPDVQQGHESYVAVSIDGRAARSDIRAAGGGDQGAAAVVFRELRSIADNLEPAGVRVLGWMPPRLFGFVCRTAFDPAARDTLEFRGGGTRDDRGGDEGLPAGVDLGAAGPIHAENSWDHYRTDSAFHRVWWAQELPRREVPAGFLWPVVLGTDVPRTLSMVLEPRDPATARRRVGAKASQQQGDQAFRQKIQRRTTAREAVEASETARREGELVYGAGMPRVTLLLSTSANTLAELDAASKQIERVAQQSSLEIMALHGEHDQAFPCAALPLAQGLSESPIHL